MCLFRHITALITLLYLVGDLACQRRQDTRANPEIRGVWGVVLDGLMAREKLIADKTLKVVYTESARSTVLRCAIVEASFERPAERWVRWHASGDQARRFLNITDGIPDQLAVEWIKSHIPPIISIYDGQRQLNQYPHGPPNTWSGQLLTSFDPFCRRGLIGSYLFFGEDWKSESMGQTQLVTGRIAEGQALLLLRHSTTNSKDRTLLESLRVDIGLGGLILEDSLFSLGRIATEGRTYSELIGELDSHRVVVNRVVDTQKINGIVLAKRIIVEVADDHRIVGELTIAPKLSKTLQFRTRAMPEEIANGGAQYTDMLTRRIYKLGRMEELVEEFSKEVKREQDEEATGVLIRRFAWGGSAVMLLGAALFIRRIKAKRANL